VNVKVKYIRPKYDNLEEWRKRRNHVYVGRKGIVFINKERYPKKDSPWCNPYKIDKHTREEVLELYEQHLREMLEDEDVLAEFLKMKGKKLGCWCVAETVKGSCVEPCKDIRCNGHTTLKVLDEY
jgi:hypothetical protein